MLTIKRGIAFIVIVFHAILVFAQEGEINIADTVTIQSETGFVILYSEASDTSDVVEAVVNGVELVVLDTIRDDVLWLLVESPSGVSGWIPTEIDGQATLAGAQSSTASEPSDDLVIEDTAIIITTTFVPVYEDADTDSAILEALVNGITVSIIDDSVMVDGQTWWKIQSPSSIEGWIPSQIDGETVLFAEDYTPEIVSTQTPIPQSQPIATFGDEVLIINFSAPEVWLRASPSTDEANWTVIPSGSITRIISSEPTTNQNINWYQVETLIGSSTGWVEQNLIVAYENTLSATLERSCSGARNYGFGVGQRFIVPYGDGVTSVWSEPNSQPLVTRVEEGNGGVIVDGPVCKDGQQGNLLTWYVETDTGQRGWIASGYSTSPIPWIVPIPDEQQVEVITTSTTQNLPIVALPIVDRQRAVRIYPTIWSLTEYQDIREPSTARYNIIVDADTTYRFAFTWCASSPQELQEILRPIAVELIVGGVLLSSSNSSRTTLDNVCEIWETLLSGWSIGQTVNLEIRYTLSEAILNGQYQAGEYIHSITATPR